jgi:exodeoxyribonuclease III
VLRVASFNVNGIRAAQRRGFEAWRDRRECDVIALQEVRCPAEQVPPGVFAGYHLTYDPGDRAGRNGVAVLTRRPPVAVRTWGAQGLPLARGLREFVTEGRYVEVDLADHPVTVASLYLPKGGLPAHLQDPRRMREAPDGGVRYERKMRFLSAFSRHLDHARRSARRSGRELLLTGDLNVAHTPMDVANWRRNQRAEGFLPEEREWVDGLLGPRRMVDVVRRLHPDGDGPYTWWSWLGQAYEKDSGWRIDYHLATPRLARSAYAAEVDRKPEPATGQRVSDHAAVVVDYDL